MDSGPRPAWAARYAAELLRRGSTESLRELVARGLQLWVTAGHGCPEAAAMVHQRAANGPIPLPATDGRAPMPSEVQRRKFTLKPRPRPLGRTEWADRFVREMQRLGVRPAPETLLEMGLHLWTTMGDMCPEDAAETEHRLFRKDQC